MLEVNNARVRRGGAFAVEFLDQGRKAGEQFGRPAQDHRVGAFQRHGGEVREWIVGVALNAHQVADGAGDLIGRRVAQRDDRRDRRVAVDVGKYLADARDIGGVVDDDQRVRAAGRHHPALSVDERLYHLERHVHIDVVEPDDLGHQLVALDPACVLRRALFRNDAVSAVGGGQSREAVGAKRRQEQCKGIVGGQRCLRYHRDFALHPRIDDERLSREHGNIADKGANVGIAHIQHLALRHRRRNGPWGNALCQCIAFPPAKKSEEDEADCGPQGPRLRCSCVHFIRSIERR